MGRGKERSAGGRRCWGLEGIEGGNKKRAKKPLLLHPPINEKRVSLLSQSHPLTS